MQQPDETYLGDGLYASFDGWQYLLRTDDGHNQKVFLEPEVMRNFLQYVASRRVAPATAE